MRGAVLALAHLARQNVIDAHKRDAFLKMMRDLAYEGLRRVSGE